MKKLFIYVVVVIALVSIFACSDNVSGVRNKKDTYIITGLLYEGRTINDNGIQVFKTIDVSSNVLDINDMAITDANITVILRDETDNIDIALSPVQGASYVYIDPSEHIIQPNHTYKIIAIIDEQEVTATTTVPQHMEILPNTTAFLRHDAELAGKYADWKFPQVKEDTYDANHPWQLHTMRKKVNLFVNFYCLIDRELWEKVEYANYFGPGDGPEEEDEYEDYAYDSWPRRIKSFYGYETNDEDLIIESGYQSGFVFYGKYRVKLYSIDDNYYKYLYKQEGYKHGGVVNGWGYFGSVSGGIMYTEVVK